ncbi:MAG: response regulator [Campylobacterota bacterium]|nr:response regulator [Campylobacterota bacterium]
MVDLITLQSLTGQLSVLYVEDDVGIRKEVERYLAKLFASFDSAENGQLGWEKYQSGHYDIVLSDISMPVMNGLEMSRKIREADQNQEIIIVSAYSSSSYFVESIQIGVSGYIIKPIDYNQMKESLYRSAVKINALKEAEDFKLHLIDKVEERTAELNQAIEAERQLQYERIDNYEKTIFSFIEMVERRDTYTAGHSERVARYSKMIAIAMGHTAEECEKLYQAAMLHDVGKVATPDSVLLKPGKLNDLEFKLIQEHVSTSYDLLKQIPMYEELAEIVHFHHERHDGRGYPTGLKGDEIPPLSRIMIVADAFDAMTTSRIYKGRMSLQNALKEIDELKGIQFHPDVAESAIAVFKEIELDEGVNQLPATELEEERFAYFFKDPLTDVYSKSYLEFVLLRNQEQKRYTYMFGLFIGHFTHFNATYGWERGDKLLADVAEWLKKSYPDTLVFRIHGDDFLLLSDVALDIDTTALLAMDVAQGSDITMQTQQYRLDELAINHVDDLESVLLR